MVSRRLALVAGLVGLLVAAPLAGTYVARSSVSPPDRATEVDLAASPPAVAGDATTYLREHLHTYTTRLVGVNHPSGERRDDLHSYAAIDPEHRRYYVRLWVRQPGEGYPPHRYFGNALTGWEKPPSANDWQPHRGWPYEEAPFALDHPDALRRSEVAVARENESVLVLAVTNSSVAYAVAWPGDRRTPAEIEASDDDPNATLSLVVDRDRGVIERAVLVLRREEHETIRVRYRFDHYDGVSISRPAELTPVTPAEVIAVLGDALDS